MLYQLCSSSTTALTIQQTHNYQLPHIELEANTTEPAVFLTIISITVINLNDLENKQILFIMCVARNVNTHTHTGYELQSAFYTVFSVG